MNPRADGPYRRALPFGDLGVAEALDVAHLDRLAVEMGKLVDQGSNLRSVFTFKQFVVGGQSRVGDREFLHLAV